MSQEDFRSRIFLKLTDWYFWPAHYLVDRFCGGGPFGLPMLVILMLVAPPVFWLSVLSVIALAIVMTLGN